MSAVIERMPDGSEKRMYRVYVDSRNVVDHENANPDEYELSLPEPIYNIAKVRLTKATFTGSAMFAVIRASGWRTVGSTMDSTSSAAVYLEAAKLASATTTHKTPVTIYNSEETVQLQVVDVFYVNIVSGDEVDTRDYAVFLCTGRMESATVSSDTFTLADASLIDNDNGSVVELISTSASDDASEYSATRNAVSTVYIATIRSAIHLSLWLNGTPLTRLAVPSVTFPPWQSFWVYQLGDIVAYTDPATDGAATVYYQCLETHFSYIFASDTTSGMWLALSTTARLQSNRDVFHVMELEDIHEHVQDTTFNKTAVEYETAAGISADTLKVKWTTDSGARFFFPSHGTMQLYSVDNAPYAYGRRVFHPHKFTLEIEYFTSPAALSASTT